MPGILHHFYFAEEVIRQTKKSPYLRQSPTTDIQKQQFFLGNVVPDLCVDRDKSHSKIESRLAPGFKVPNLFYLKSQVSKLDNLYLGIGIYAHLYLDAHFVEDFLFPQFDFSWRDDCIRSQRTGKTYTTKEFFSPKGLYHGYAELNRIIVSRKLVDLDYVRALPDKPALTGMGEFDDRVDTSWKDELEGCLTHHVQTRGTVFLANQFQQFIANAARAFRETEMAGYF